MAPPRAHRRLERRKHALLVLLLLLGKEERVLARIVGRRRAAHQQLSDTGELVRRLAPGAPHTVGKCP